MKHLTGYQRVGYSNILQYCYPYGRVWFCTIQTKMNSSWLLLEEDNLRAPLSQCV